MGIISKVKSAVKKAVAAVKKIISPPEPPKPAKSSQPLTSAPGYKAPSYTPSKPALSSAPGYKAPTVSGNGGGGSSSYAPSSSGGSSGGGGGSSSPVSSGAGGTFGDKPEGIIENLNYAGQQAMEKAPPFSTALGMVSGGTSKAAAKALSPAAKAAAKAGAAKAAEAISIRSAAKAAAKAGKANTKVGKLITKIGLITGLTTGAAFLVKSAVESYGMAGWAGKEAFDPMQSYTANAIAELNDPELLRERAEILDELSNPSAWEKIISAVPWINTIQASKQSTKSNAWGAKVGSAILKNKAEALETGISQEEIARKKMMAEWEEYDQRKIQRQKDLLLWEEAERDRDMAEDAAFKRGEEDYYYKQRKKERQETSDFWRNHELEMQRLEEEERERIRQFWLDYKKMLAKIESENGRSSLRFGLFG